MSPTDFDFISSSLKVPHELEGSAVTLYGASSPDIPQIYKKAAYDLGQTIAHMGLAVVCGGGSAGLMGAATDGALSAGGTVVGVLPQFMISNGWNYPLLTHTIPVPDMHTRKAIMARLAGVAVAMPGGIGTFEELFEIITWKQLGLWPGKIVMLNTDGYYDPILAMLDRAEAQNFLRRHGNGGQPLFTVAATAAEAGEIISAELCD